VPLRSANTSDALVVLGDTWFKRVMKFVAV